MALRFRISYKCRRLEIRMPCSLAGGTTGGRAGGGAGGGAGGRSCKLRNPPRRGTDGAALSGELPGTGAARVTMAAPQNNRETAKGLGDSFMCAVVVKMTCLKDIDLIARGEIT